MQSDGNRQSQMKSHLLPLSLSPSSTSQSFTHPLPLSFSLHFHAFSLLLLLSLLDSISSPRFIVLFFFLLSLLLFVFFSSSCFTLKQGNWSSLLRSICCHTNACTSTMLYILSLFYSPISALSPSLYPLNLPHPSPVYTHTHNTKTQVVPPLLSSQQVA